MSSKWLRLSVVLIGVLAAACDSHTEQPMDAHELIAHGAHIYLEYCAECHQVDGTGWSTLYPRLAGNPIVTLRDPQPIIETVLYGQGSMTGFREKLDGYDIAAVLSYIRSSWGNDAVPVSYRQIH